MFIDDFKITTEAPTAAGTSTIDSAAYDMAGFTDICFIVRLGSPAANNNIRARQSATSGGTYNDLQGTLVNDAVKNQHMLEIVRPGKQFVRCRVTRGTTTTIDSLIAIQYRARGLRPVVQPSSVSESWVSPPEGLA
jgi:hypothetical protein